MSRVDLPVLPARLDARELLNFFRRAIREENQHDLRIIKEEYERRGLRIPQSDYWVYRRIMSQGGES